ncbi:MAG: exo-alpha-sialidase [Planctomycetes bacterium]|nr:exo-alpha-sialidase [Planctomycetota bacterium]
MVCFTQATGPTKNRASAPKDVRQKLNWPPAGAPDYDMTGLDLRNVHLRSSDGGKSWKQVSADSFKSCMNGVTGEAQTALSDGTVVRGVWGFYLPFDKELPRTGYLQRSKDGTRSWSKPAVLLDPSRYSAWPRRIRVLRDGRLIALLGVASIPAGTHTRTEFSRKVVPMLVVSADNGNTWKGPIAAVPEDQSSGWTEEFDVAELDNGDLLAVFRRDGDSRRWQGLLKKSGATWVPQKASMSVLPHSGQPELLATREGPILHVATSGIHCTTDAGKNWKKLDVPGTAYYPRSVQSRNGRIFVFGHLGGDDAYGKVDQSIVMDTFQLATNAMPDADKNANKNVPGFAVKPGVRQLCLDDVGIEKIDHLQRVVNQPRRHPANPVLKGEHPWEKMSASVYGTMLYDANAKLFRLWYLCSPAPPSSGRKWVEVGGYRRVTNCTLLAYATSKNGVQWDKPKLNQLSFEGSKKNNLLDIGIDNPEGVGVLHAPHEKDPARRYVAFFWDRRLTPPDDPTGVDEKLAKVQKEPTGLTERQRAGGMWVAFSPDGIVWKTHGPVLPQGSDTTHTILYDAKLKRYVAFGRMGFGRTVARTESDDGLKWSDPKLVLACDGKDGPGGQIYGMPTDLYEGLYVGMFWMYREGTDARIDTQLAVSRDGTVWNRAAGRQTFLANAPEGSWDDGMSRAGRGINVVGDTIYLHYSMVNGPHRSPKFPKVERKFPGAIGLVTLRRDGFVSLDAQDKAGTLMTRPFVLSAGELHINADTAAGTLQVAVCDESGKSIKGFEQSRQIRSSRTDVVVSWKGAKLESLRGQTVRLRFTLQRGKLFSYWLTPAASS